MAKHNTPHGRATGDDLRRLVRAQIDKSPLNSFEISLEAGLNRSYLWELLSGKKDSMSPRCAARLAAVLGCDLADILGPGVTEPPRPATTGVSGIDIRMKSGTRVTVTPAPAGRLVEQEVAAVVGAILPLSDT